MKIEEGDDDEAMDINNQITIIEDLPSPSESILVGEYTEPSMVEG